LIAHYANPPARRWPRLTMVWFLGLLILCYAPVLKLLVLDWEQNEDMGHGFFVPILAGYIAWQNRERILAVRPHPNYLGLVLVLFAALQLYVATLGAEMFLARTAFIFSLTGAILFLGGSELLKVLAFPILLLFFMVPLPAIIYNQITFPLQLFASRVAEGALALLDIPVIREGNILELASQKLSVVEACSGIRSLLTLSFLSLIYAYFFDRKIWMRWVLFAATIPIAILSNAFRVTLTGILSEYKKEYAEGFFHEAQGWVIYLVALVILMMVHTAINAVYHRFSQSTGRVHAATQKPVR
jgi:exosortase